MASKFGRRHYEAIAEAMQAAHPNGAGNGDIATGAALEWSECVRQLSNVFARDNGDFKRSRFEAACRPGANVKARTRYELQD